MLAATITESFDIADQACSSDARSDGTGKNSNKQNGCNGSHVFLGFFGSIGSSQIF
jgi:hypothetical protein